MFPIGFPDGQTSILVNLDPEVHLFRSALFREASDLPLLVVSHVFIRAGPVSCTELLLMNKLIIIPRSFVAELGRL